MGQLLQLVAFWFYSFLRTFYAFFMHYEGHRDVESFISALNTSWIRLFRPPQKRSSASVSHQRSTRMEKVSSRACFLALAHVCGHLHVRRIFRQKGLSSPIEPELHLPCPCNAKRVSGWRPGKQLISHYVEILMGKMRKTLWGSISLTSTVRNLGPLLSACALRERGHI